MDIKLFNADCLDQIQKIEEKVNLVVVDLPYGQTDFEWDIVIDLNQMWKELKKVCKRNCIYIFFTTTKFGYKLIQSNEKWFCYDLVWEKSKKAGFLSANKMPLRKHEMIYIFEGDSGDDLDNSRNHELRDYFTKVKKYIGKTKKEILKDCGSVVANNHCLYTTTTQFRLPTEQTYNILIDKYKINEMEGFREFKELKPKWEKYIRNNTYNPQKTEGKAYITRRKGNIVSVYGTIKRNDIDNKGDRFPHSILRFSNPPKSLHPTQKPVELCEWLIKSYSNEGDLVLDFTMGSGTTGIACMNTKRRFIGIEKDKAIYETAKKRIDEHALIRNND